MSGVGVRRGTAHLLRSVDWPVELDERWVVLGPNGAGKTTLLQLAAAQLHPSSGTAEVLGERLGRVDVFELRPRIGLTSAALAGRVPNNETVLDVVVSAGYAVVGRWREEYDVLDTGRARHLLYQLGVQQLADRGAGHPPRGGDPAGHHARAAAAQRHGRRGRADRRRADGGPAQRDVRDAAGARPDRRAVRSASSAVVAATTTKAAYRTWSAVLRSRSSGSSSAAGQCSTRSSGASTQVVFDTEPVTSSAA